MQSGESHHAYFTNKGALVGTITDKQFEDLPDRARLIITKNYDNYDITAVALYDDNEKEPGGLVLNSNAFDNWDTYFVKLSNKKDKKEIMLKVSLSGDVSVFKKVTQ